MPTKMGFRKSMIIAFFLYYLQDIWVWACCLHCWKLPDWWNMAKLRAFQGWPTVANGGWLFRFVCHHARRFVHQIYHIRIRLKRKPPKQPSPWLFNLYMMVNFGAFTGKTIIDPLRNAIGEQAYIYINFFSATMTILALLSVVLLYKSAHTAGEGKSMREIGQGFLRIITNWRLLILIPS